MISRTRRIAMVGFADAQMLDICGPLEVFSRASRVMTNEGRRGADIYQVELLAHRAGPVRMSSGIDLVAARSFKSVRGGLETLIVAGGRGVRSEERRVGKECRSRW